MSSASADSLTSLIETLALIGVATLFLLPWLWEKLIPSLTYAVLAVVALLVPIFLVIATVIAIATGSLQAGRTLLIVTAVVEPLCLTSLTVLGFFVLRKKYDRWG